MIASELSTREGTSWSLDSNQALTGTSWKSFSLHQSQELGGGGIQLEIRLHRWLRCVGSGFASTPCCTTQHLRWDPSTETVGISSAFTVDASGCKKPIKNIDKKKRSSSGQKLELMMTELDQIKMRIFDQKFSKDGLDCRQVI